MMTRLHVFNHYLLQGLFLLGVGCSVSCGSTAVDPIDLQGQWHGAYAMAEVYDYTGAASLKIDVSENPQILTMEMKFKGELFETADSDYHLVILKGPYSPLGTTVTGTSDLMGNMELRLFPNGTMKGTAEPKLFPDMALVGQLSKEEIKIKISLLTFLSTDVTLFPERSIADDPQ